MFKSLLLFLLLSQVGAAQEYEITIQGPVTIRVKVVGDTPVPPSPTPDPTPDPVAGTIEVGPGKAYEDLAGLPPIAANTKIVLYGREQPYRAKLGLLADGIQLIGINRPVISGKDAATPKSSPVRQADLQSSIVFTDDSERIAIRGIDFQDCWEEDSFALQDGTRVKYQGGAAAIRVLGGSVTVEDCHFSRLIHAVFSKSAKGKSRVTLKDCTVTNCGNSSGSADEAVYLEDDESTLEDVTIKDSRNPGTTCLHCRSRQLALKDCRFEGGGLLVYTDSVSEADSPCLTDGKLLDARASISGGTFISRSASPFFTLRSDIGPDIAIRSLTVSDATLIAIGDQKSRYRRTIGTPSFEGNKIAYTGCTIAVMPATEGQPSTALEYADAFTKGTVEIGKGNVECLTAGRIGGSDSVTPANWKELIEVNPMSYAELKEKFLTED